MNICPMPEFFAKVGFKWCQILNKPFKFTKTSNGPIKL